MKLICWNLHALPIIGSRVVQRLKAAAATIANEAPDVVLLQEIWTRQAFNTIQRALDGNYSVFVGDRGPGRNCGGLVTCVRRATWQASGPAAFTRYTAYGPVLKFWQGDGLFKKGVLGVTASHLASGQRLVFLNTHLQSQYGYYRDAGGMLRTKEAYIPERTSQLRELAGVARRDHELPVLVGGDFNSTPDEWPALHLPAEWLDLTEQLRQSGEPATYIEKTGPMAWYDYVFAQPTATVSVRADARLILNTAVDYPYSDHHGLVIDLTLD